VGAWYRAAALSLIAAGLPLYLAAGTAAAHGLPARRLDRLLAHVDRHLAHVEQRLRERGADGFVELLEACAVVLAAGVDRRWWAPARDRRALRRGT
jgi:hypothetical protein